MARESWWQEGRSEANRNEEASAGVVSCAVHWSLIGVQECPHTRGRQCKISEPKTGKDSPHICGMTWRGDEGFHSKLWSSTSCLNTGGTVSVPRTGAHRDSLEWGLSFKEDVEHSHIWEKAEDWIWNEGERRDFDQIGKYIHYNRRKFFHHQKEKCTNGERNHSSKCCDAGLKLKLCLWVCTFQYIQWDI